MTSASFLIAVFALAILVVFGFALLTLLAPDAHLWWFERASFSFLLGVGAGAFAWRALMPVYGIVGPRLALTLVAGGALGLAASRAGILHLRRLQQPSRIQKDPAYVLTKDPVCALTIVCSCVLVVQLGVLLAASLHTPLGWDALFNWEMKARLAFEHQPQGQLPAAYFSDASRAWSHPRYPLTVPFAEFWIYSWLGHIDQIAVKIVFPLFFCALVASACGAIRRLTTAWMAAAAGIALGLMPPLAAGSGAVTGYADIPLAAAITAAGSCAILALRTSRTEMFMVAAALAAVAAWTKVEGLMLAICLGSAVAIASISRSRRSPVSRVPTWAATAIVWVPVLLVCPWIVWHGGNGIPDPDFPSMSPGVALANLYRLPEILTLMARELVKPGRWGLLWPAFAAACVLAAGRRERDGMDLVAAGAVIVPFFAYAAIFLFSGWDSVAQHVGSSIERLLTPLASSALIFTVSRAWRSFT